MMQYSHSPNHSFRASGEPTLARFLQPTPPTFIPCPSTTSITIATGHHSVLATTSNTPSLPSPLPSYSGQPRPYRPFLFFFHLAPPESNLAHQVFIVSPKPRLNWGEPSLTKRPK